LLKYLLVGIGGCLGSILRFWLGTYIGSKMGTRFPYWRYLIPIGFIGGYTTFSSFEYETLRSIQDGQIGLGLLYVATSVVIGFVAVWGGMIAGRAIS